MEMMTVLKPENVKLLVKIQQELKAPKSQYNSFGKYSYRSAEDILDAVKPIAHAYGCAIGCNDSLEHIEGRFYVHARAFIVFPDGETFATSSYAREEDTKKGMDGSQITGSSSSYARKYAFSALLACDDSKDSDATNDHGRGESAAKPQAAAKPQTTDKPQPKTNAQLAAKQKQFGELCRAYKKAQTEEQQPLEALLFDTLSSNGFDSIAGLKGCTNELVFSQLIDIIDMALASAK